ncbi:MAG: response regulator, partial [Acidobacteria bacterium]|nr:response regulator [Acidobacteriota bacterium]
GGALSAPVQEFVSKERRGLCGWVIENRQPLLTNDAPNDARSIGTPPDHFPIRRFLSVPALAGESVVGQIAVANSGREYSGRDLALVERMANLYALAIQRMHEEAALRKSEAGLARAQRIARLGSWESDLVTAGVEWSEEVYRIFEQPRTFRPTRDTFARLIHPDDRAAVAAAVAKSLATGDPYDIEHRIVLPDGSQRYVHEQAEVVMDDAGKPVRLIGTAHDVTATRQLEEQLAHSQKMEAVGRLAGGVAHDFNNLLTVITGYCELSLAQLEDADPLKENIVEIRRAGERAASLTGQLLAFSRRQMLQPQVLDLNSVIAGTERMLRRLIGEDIELVTHLNPETGAVKVDAGQLQQVVMNLAVNARDAMPKGGKLTIETANAVLDETYVKKHIGVQPGPYVMIAVSDTGVGMGAETQSHIFEPFFTTKGRGKGTGLGLSTVYGIVKQSGGEPTTPIETGKGTTFKIYLPRIFDAAPENTETAVTDARGTGTILLVEDEEAVRTLAIKILEKAGYRLLVAADPAEALRLVGSFSETIDLMITDVIMPGMSGRDLARELETSRPSMQVLYISGYTDNAIVHHGVLEAGLHFVQKPFTPQALTLKVREVLAGNGQR